MQSIGRDAGAMRTLGFRDSDGRTADQRSHNKMPRRERLLTSFGEQMDGIVFGEEEDEPGANNNL